MSGGTAFPVMTKIGNYQGPLLREGNVHFTDGKTGEEGISTIEHGFAGIPEGAIIELVTDVNGRALAILGDVTAKLGMKIVVPVNQLH